MTAPKAKTKKTTTKKSAEKKREPSTVIKNCEFSVVNFDDEALTVINKLAEAACETAMALETNAEAVRQLASIFATGGYRCGTLLQISRDDVLVNASNFSGAYRPYDDKGTAIGCEKAK